MATDALVLEQVNSHYGDSHVLYSISLTLRAGSLLALLGRNGAGKTTTMKTISGLLEATSGKILLFGQDIAKKNPENKRAVLRIIQKY